MKLIFINGPYGYARDIKAMEIFRNAVDNAGWLDENDSLASGDVVGFDFGDDRVRATVDIRKDSIEIRMASPLKYDYARSWHLSFFSRNNWLHDDTKVKAAVHGALTELYYDFAMVKSRKDDLVAHSRGYRHFRESLPRIRVHNPIGIVLHSLRFSAYIQWFPLRISAFYYKKSLRISAFLFLSFSNWDFIAIFTSS